MKKKVLLIGSESLIANFILSNKKKKKFSFYGVDIKSSSKFITKTKYIQHDLSKSSLYLKKFKGINFSAVIILSFVMGHKSKDKLISLNKKIINNSINLSKSLKIKKLIFASSSATYGNYKNKIYENFKLKPIKPYGLSKVISEKLIIKNSFFKSSKVYNYSILRIFNIYAPHERNLIYNFFKLKKSNKPITIFGDGNQYRDFIFIDDVVDIIFIILNQNDKKDLILNVCSGRRVKLINLVKKITKNIVFKKPIKLEPVSICGSNNKLKKNLNWKPKFTIDKGLKKIKKLF